MSSGAITTRAPCSSSARIAFRFVAMSLVVTDPWILLLSTFAAFASAARAEDEDIEGEIFLGTDIVVR